MATHVINYVTSTGRTLYAFPESQSLADWATYRVELVEGSGANLSRYTGTIDDENGLAWQIFEGASQPASWVDSLAAVFIETPAELVAAILEESGSITVTVFSPVASTGQFSQPLILGDDYKASLGNGLSWNVPKLTGVDVGDAECYFGIKNQAGDGFIVEGAVTEVDANTWKIAFDIPKATFTGLTKGDYEWSAEVRDASANEVTRVRNADFNYRVKLVEKQT